MKLTYSATATAALTGATPRMLQWWDETGLIVPARRRGRGGPGCPRMYLPWQVLTVRVMLNLRKRGLSPGKLRRILPNAAHIACAVLANQQRPAWLITDGVGCVVRTDYARVLALAETSKRACWVVNLADLAASLLDPPLKPLP